MTDMKSYQRKADARICGYFFTCIIEQTQPKTWQAPATSKSRSSTPFNCTDITNYVYFSETKTRAVATNLTYARTNTARICARFQSFFLLEHRLRCRSGIAIHLTICGLDRTGRMLGVILDPEMHSGPHCWLVGRFSNTDWTEIYQHDLRGTRRGNSSRPGLYLNFLGRDALYFSPIYDCVNYQL